VAINLFVLRSSPTLCRRLLQWISTLLGGSLKDRSLAGLMHVAFHRRVPQIRLFRFQRFLEMPQMSQLWPKPDTPKRSVVSGSSRVALLIGGGAGRDMKRHERPFGFAIATRKGGEKARLHQTVSVAFRGSSLPKSTRQVLYEIEQLCLTWSRFFLNGY
jgi:hypothetical protein